MFNCLAKICPLGRANVVVSAATVPPAQPVAPPTSAPLLPTVPVLSASAQARWRQLCNQPLKNQVDARALLMPGARLDFSCAERTEIGRALAELPSGTQFWSGVATACTLGNPVKFAAVETLLRHGLLDPNQITDGNTLLETVCLYGENAWPRLENPLTLGQRITSLVALGAAIGREELSAMTLLQRTWERNDADCHLAASALITQGCNPLQRDEHGRNLLHHAADEGNMPVLRGWQRAGLPMHMRAERPARAAIHLAAIQGHHEALRFLVTEGGVDINALTLEVMEGRTALHYAVQNAHLEAARTLLELHATADLADLNGITPLMLAVSQRSEPMRKLLVQFGANPDTVVPRNWEFPTAVALYQAIHGHPWPDDT